MRSKKRILVKYIILFLFSIGIVFTINSSVFYKSVKVASYTDLSTAHGAGYSQLDNNFVIQSEDSFFLYDLGEEICRYNAIEIVRGEADTNSVQVEVWHSSAGDESDTKKAKKISGKGNCFSDNFKKNRFIRFYLVGDINDEIIISEISIFKQKINVFSFGSLFALLIFIVLFIIDRIIGDWVSGIMARFLSKALAQYNKIDIIFAKKINNRIVRMMIFLIPQVPIFIWMIFFNGIFYDLNDDILMNNIASGALGSPSEFVCSSSPIFGWLCKILFIIVPTINWWGLWYLFIMLSSTVMIDYVISKKDNTIINEIVISSILLLYIMTMFSFFTFTIVAYSGEIASILLLCSLEEKGKIRKIEYIISVVMLIVSASVRYKTFFSLVICVALLFAFKLVVKREKNYVLIIATMLLSCLFVVSASKIINNSSTVQSDYMKWNKARTSVTEFNSKDEVLESSEWSEVETNMIYGAMLWDKDNFSAERFNNTFDKNLFDEIKNNYYLLDGWITIRLNSLIKWYSASSLYLVIFLLVWCMAIIVSKKDRIYVVLLGLGAIGTDMAFYLYGRNIYRMVMPVYLFAVVGMCMWLVHDKKLIIKITALVMCIVLNVCSVVNINNTNHVRHENAEKNIAVLEFFENNSDKLYFPCNIEGYNIELSTNIWKFEGTYPANLCGNWTSYSASYYEQMEAYGIDQPNRIVLEMPDSDVIRLFTIRGNDIPDYVEEFIESKCNVDVEFVVEDVISVTSHGEMVIYKVITK